MCTFIWVIVHKIILETDVHICTVILVMCASVGVCTLKCSETRWEECHGQCTPGCGMAACNVHKIWVNVNVLDADDVCAPPDVTCV